MRAAAEGHHPVARPADDERVGILPLVGVEVGGEEVAQHPVVLRDDDAADLGPDAIAIHEDQRVLIGQRQGLQRRIQTLSNREAEVMRLMLQGRLNKQIAHALGIAIRTVEVHRSRVLEKMHFKTNADITSYALRNGLIQ